MALLILLLLNVPSFDINYKSRLFVSLGSLSRQGKWEQVLDAGFDLQKQMTTL